MKVEEALEHFRMRQYAKSTFRNRIRNAAADSSGAHFVTWADIPPGKQSIVQII
jgi:hypothetical protein